ncbi:MAG: thiol reductase thioredoxin, partial [Pseudomonadales bacterium]
MDVISVVCPHCFVRNRVPEPRMAEAPKCGGCHAQLFTGKPTPVNASQLNKMLRGNDIPVVVDYWAS